MIAQARWFSRRKYTGWGLAPASREGVIYILAIAGVLALIRAIPIGETMKLVLTGTWIVFILTDTLQAMVAIKLDEREQKTEAIAERNASWTMVASTVLSMLYVTSAGNSLRGTQLVPVLMGIILCGMLVKGITYFILEKRGV